MSLTCPHRMHPCSSSVTLCSFAAGQDQLSQGGQHHWLQVRAANRARRPSCVAVLQYVCALRLHTWCCECKLGDGLSAMSCDTHLASIGRRAMLSAT